MAEATLATIPWQSITPNEAGDWLNQRNAAFDAYPAISGEPSSYFTSNSRGLETTRDAWVYNASRNAVESNMRRMIDAYNTQASAGHTTESELDLDPMKISWSRDLRRRALRGATFTFNPDGLRHSALYRPFTKQAVYFDPIFGP